MKIVSKEDAGLWCHQHQVVLNDRGLPNRSDFLPKFSIPTDAGHRVYLVSEKMTAFREEPNFLVWLDDWSVWPSGERMHIFERFRLSYGESRRLIDAPGHIFEQGDIEDALSFVTLAVLFLWDCYVLTPQGNKLLFFSHDEYGLSSDLVSEEPKDA